MEKPELIKLMDKMTEEHDEHTSKQGGRLMQIKVVAILENEIRGEESKDVNSRSWDKLETLYGLLRIVSDL